MNNIYVLRGREDPRVIITCLVPPERVGEVTRKLAIKKLRVTFQYLGIGVHDRIAIDATITRLGYPRDRFDSVRTETKKVPRPNGTMTLFSDTEVPVSHDDSRNNLDLMNFFVPLSQLAAFMKRLKRIDGLNLVPAPPREEPSRWKKRRPSVVSMEPSSMVG